MYYEYKICANHHSKLVNDVYNTTLNVNVEVVWECCENSSLEPGKGSSLSFCLLGGGLAVIHAYSVTVF